MRKVILVVVVIAVAVASACYKQMPVAQRDWGVVRPEHPIRVQTQAGTTHTFPHFVFTTTAVHGWPNARSAGDSAGERVTVPLDSIAAVRVRQLDRGATALVTVAAATAAFFIIAETRDDVRPPAQPRPVETSCPFLYSFDGSEYRFDSETYAGAVTRGLERQDVDNLDHLRAVDGQYRLRLTNERPETHYTDELALLVADHPRGTRALTDAVGRVHIVAGGAQPKRVTPFGTDTAPGRTGWELAFRRPAGGATRMALMLRLRNTPVAPFALQQVLDLLGRDVHPFYRALTSDERTRAGVREWMMREGGLAVSLGGADAPWIPVTVLPDVGPAIAKTLVVPFDATAGTADVRVKLESSPMLWLLEHAELAEYLGEAEPTRLSIASARDETGADVRPALEQRDRRWFIALNGSRVDITFDAPPPPAPTFERTVLARTTGHYYIYSKDSVAGNPALVHRLMSDREFSQRYIGEAYLKTLK